MRARPGYWLPVLLVIVGLAGAGVTARARGASLTARHHEAGVTARAQGASVTARLGGRAGHADGPRVAVRPALRLTAVLDARRPTTSSTNPGIAGRVPHTLTTVPFTPRQPTARISPIFAEVSIGGFGVFVLIGAVQFGLTRPGRRGRRTL